MGNSQAGSAQDPVPLIPPMRRAADEKDVASLQHPDVVLASFVQAGARTVVDEHFLSVLRLGMLATKGSWGAVLEGLEVLRSAHRPDCLHQCLLEGLALQNLAVERHAKHASLRKQRGLQGEAGAAPQAGAADGGDRALEEDLLRALHSFLRGLRLCALHEERQASAGLAHTDSELALAVFPYIKPNEFSSADAPGAPRAEQLDSPFSSPSAASASSSSAAAAAPAQPQQFAFQQPAAQQGSCNCEPAHLALLRWAVARRLNAEPLLAYPLAAPLSPVLRPELAYPAIYAYEAPVEVAWRASGKGGRADNWGALELAKAYAELLQELRRRGQGLEIVLPGKGKQADQVRVDEEYARLVVLEAWLRRHGCAFPKLRLSNYNNEARGVHAAVPIPPNDRVLDVPLPLLFTSESAAASPLVRSLSFRGAQFTSQHTPLALHLLQERERGVRSFWYPYIASLPQDYRFMPAFFTEPELDFLRGSFALRKISEQLQGFISEYRVAVRSEPKLGRFSLQDFMWGRFAIITRIFGMNIQDRDTQSLVPYADMLNHKFPKQTLWSYDNHSRSFAITAINGIAAGQQVFDTYGRKCNSRYLVNYGFVLDRNEEDNEAQLAFELRPGQDPLALAKCEHLWTPAGIRRVYQVPADTASDKTSQMLGFARVIFCTSEKDLNWVRFNRTSGKPLKPFSAENEWEALRGIRASAEQSLARFPDSLSYDVALLKGALQQLQMLENDADAQGELVDGNKLKLTEAAEARPAEAEEFKQGGQGPEPRELPEPRPSFRIVSLAGEAPGAEEEGEENGDEPEEPQAPRPEEARFPGHRGPWMRDHLGQRVPRTTNFRNCVVQRAGEKRVLDWFRVLADLACTLLLLRPAEQLAVLGLLREAILPPAPAPPVFQSLGARLPERREPAEALRKRLRHLWPEVLRRHPGFAERLGAHPDLFRAAAAAPGEEEACDSSGEARSRFAELKNSVNNALRNGVPAAVPVDAPCGGPDDSEASMNLSSDLSSDAEASASASQPEPQPEPLQLQQQQQQQMQEDSSDGEDAEDPDEDEDNERLRCPMLSIPFDMLPALHDAGSRQRWIVYLEAVIMKLNPVLEQSQLLEMQQQQQLLLLQQRPFQASASPPPRGWNVY